MYRRLIGLSVIIIGALAALAWLGYRAIEMQAWGMEGRRIGQFASVGEQIRRDVNRKLDRFIKAEQNRPHTDYQYYHVENGGAVTRQAILPQRSPLAGSLENEFAYGYFQIDKFSNISTPYYKVDADVQQPEVSQLQRARLYVDNIGKNLLPVLKGASSPESGTLNLDQQELLSNVMMQNQDAYLGTDDKEEQTRAGLDKSKISPKSQKKGNISRRANYNIESLNTVKQEPQIYSVNRALIDTNQKLQTQSPTQVQMPQMQMETPGQQRITPQAADRRFVSKPEAEVSDQEALETQVVQSDQANQPAPTYGRYTNQNGNTVQLPPPILAAPTTTEKTAAEFVLKEIQTEYQQDMAQTFQENLEDRFSQALAYSATVSQTVNGPDQSDLVQVRVEPFVPMVAPFEQETESMFPGQIFLLRHVQIENDHYVQGFQLNEAKLIEAVKESANRFMREGMSFEIAKTEYPNVAYAAIMEFGFGNLVLNLMESEPGWIGREIGQLRIWYFSIVAVVYLAVVLGLVSVWRNMNAQVKLARKKDDFISAVSHELRTPLTSLRMYSEMLEKDWVKTPDKRGEYYRNMRQESERLSRLIENVLDFSRIQRRRKKYDFTLGDINQCIAKIIEMMKPYAEQAGFTIMPKFGDIEQTAFDSDAVMQIVINLIDNSIKYARNAEDRRIIVRTGQSDGYVIIEVEDHGPGVPHRQRQKVFDEFYRCEDESRRETTGVGLGLALVRKFAQAHHGFVEILNAKPTGAIFRVGLAAAHN